MLQYSYEEAYLQIWRIKLMRFEKSAEQEKLLAIINSKAPTHSRFFEFNELKNSISLQQDEQGWSFFSWLWSLLTCCFSDPEPELGLKDLLSDVVSPKKFKRLSAKNSGEDSSEELLKDSAYVEALFNNPEKAFMDLQSRINKLSKDGDINRVLERLNAIKYHLEPHCYQNILASLYKKFPLETLSAQYAEFCKDPDKLPGSHEFIENELICRELMSLFISNLDKDPIVPCCGAIQELELMLLLSYSDNPPLQTMLKKAIQKKMDPADCYQLFGQFFREAKEQIIARLPEAEREADKKREESAFDTQIYLMKIALAYPDDIFQINPLHKHLAKLACQELITNYHQMPQQTSFRDLHKTIRFLSADVLDTWSAGQAAKSDNWNLKYTASESEAYINYSEVHKNYKNAVFFANRIAFTLFFDELYNESKLEQVIAEFPGSFLANQTKLAPHELTWILSVVEMVRPNEPKTLKKVEILLLNLGSSPEEVVRPFERKHSKLHLSANRSGFHHQPQVRASAQDPAPRNLALS